jgi:anaerobic selenocysteine-containing dehydrogenase
MSRVVKTLCQMCYFYCGLDVTVKDDRIVKVAGMKEHPGSRGRLCPRGLAAPQLVTDPNRLTCPLRRKGERGSGRWQEISWEAALDEISEKMLSVREESGAEYCAYYRGQGPGWVTNFNYVWRFMNSWGSPNLFSHSHLCFVPRAVAHAATFGPFPEPDYENTNCILLIGYNPVNTSPVNYAPRVVWAKRSGAKLIVVDPRFTSIASKADLYLQVRPGTTGALVLAMIRVIIEEGLYDRQFIDAWTVGFDALEALVQDYDPKRVESICQVPADQIRDAARMVATIKPSVVVEGNGLDQHTNTVQTVRTTSILRALIKSVDQKGGSVMVPSLPFKDVQRRGDQPADFYDRSVCEYPLYARGGFGLTGIEMINSLETGNPFRVKSLIVQGGDPVAVLSESKRVVSALNKLEFLVVHDLYPTATSRIADIVLPAASFLERDLVLNYRYRPSADSNLIAMQNQCISPIGESRSDLDFIFALARKVGLSEHFPWKNVIEAFDWELEPNNINVAWLKKNPGGFLRKYSPEELYRKYEKNGFPSTPSGKIEFYASRFEEYGYDPLPRFKEPALSPRSMPNLAEGYPLIGSTCLKLGLHTHTQFRSLPWIRAKEPEPFAEINPETAVEAGIEDGDWMWMETPKGRTRLRARLTLAVHPRVVIATHGYGEPYAGCFDLANNITSHDERDPIAGPTGNRSFLCRISRVST